MRGFPILSGLSVLVAAVLLWIPLCRVTGKAGGAYPTMGNTPTADPPRPVVLRLRFAHAPLRASVSHLGAVVWETNDPFEWETGFAVALVIPPDGIELELSATWPDSTPETAVELEVEPEALETKRAVAWGRDSLEEVLTFTWPELSASP